MTERTDLEPIPQPPGRPIIGNLLEMRAEVPFLNLMSLARVHGPIYRLRLGPRNSMLVLSSFELIDQISDDRRFEKYVGPGLRQARVIVADGLFTALNHEPNWRKAHNILLPSFSTQAIRSYLPEMQDIALQLVEKWSRLNPEDEVDVVGDMTRVTLDTIGLAAFDYRFNSFYSEDPHPFIRAMNDALEMANQNLGRPEIQRRLMVRANRRLSASISVMNGLVDHLIAQRQEEGGAGRTDLLQAMLDGVDRQSGEKLDPVNIRYQVLTFLIAGHETTSGLLSFALYYLMRSPEVLAKAREEVDRVLGGDLSPPGQDRIRELRYLSQVLKEALRIWPTAPGFVRRALEPSVLADRFAIGTEDSLLTLIPMLHRDPAIWGDDPEAFDPERFSPEAEERRPPNAFKPFGTGQRACIGRHFATLEATLVLAMVLQRFDFEDFSDYELKVRQTLTLKPVGFRIKVRPRSDRPTSIPVEVPAAAVAEPETASGEQPLAAVAGGTPLLVLYGSNMGSAEAIAREIAEDGTLHGYATRVAPLDEFVGKVPTEGAVAIVSSSYNGTPPDNAAGFYEWLCEGSLGERALEDVTYTVFGCGDRDWSDTYQRVPQDLDAALAAHGATRFYERGEGDQSGDFDGQYRGWYDHLWQAAADALGAPGELAEPIVKSHRYEVEVLPEPEEVEPLVALYGARPFEVLVNRELHVKDGPAPSERSVRHLEFALPEGVAYRAGDHLGILPHNGRALVERALARFGLAPDAHVRIRANSAAKSVLPLDTPVSVEHILGRHLALQDPARRSDIQVLADYAEDPAERERLLTLGGDDPESVVRYREEVLGRTVSVLDLLEEAGSCRLPLNIFLELLQPLKPRYYSISSSALVDPRRCSVTVGLVEGPARSGRGQYRGVASGYLAGLRSGDTVEAFVRPPSLPFFPPEEPGVPMIMVGAGTGLAPYRGFLQDRRQAREQGRDVGPSLLFFGCRNPAQDYLYRDELEGLEEEGIVELAPAFSRLDGSPKTYVQDRIAAEAGRAWELLEAGGTVYVCGDAATMAPAVERAFVALQRQRSGASEAEGEAWMAALKADNRYLVDIWPKN